MAQTRSERALRLIESRGGVLRARDFREEGIPAVCLSRLCQRGLLERVSRGLYRLVGAEVTEHHDLAEATRRVPRGVVCLLSALVFHELTDENPFEVWMAIDPKAWRPRVEHPPIRFCRFSGAALTEGVQSHVIEGADVPIYGPEKTIADCLKYRGKIGLDLAVKALRRYLARPRKHLDELLRSARICRVETMMRRYLEAVL